MSKLDYSKWDRLELSDDEDIECHPNIDKASFVRWKQADIHRKREERHIRIAQLKQEHDTNTKLLVLIRSTIDQLSQQISSDDEVKALYTRLANTVLLYEKERKPVLFNPEHEEYLQPKSVDEVFSMLLSRLFEEKKLAVSSESFEQKLRQMLVDEIPKLNKRQEEVVKTISVEETERDKKITSENMFTETFSKTVRFSFTVFVLID
jgi:cell division cycle protein 37